MSKVAATNPTSSSASRRRAYAASPEQSNIIAQIKHLALNAGGKLISLADKIPILVAAHNSSNNSINPLPQTRQIQPARKTFASYTEPVYTGPTFKVGSLVFDSDAQMILYDETILNLSPRGTAAFIYLARRKGHVVKKGELFDRVWRRPLNERRKTVEDALHDIRKELDNYKLGGMIKSVYSEGYTVSEDL